MFALVRKAVAVAGKKIAGTLVVFLLQRKDFLNR